MTESLTYRTRPAAGEPEGALILMHGRGADEHDLEPLMDELDPERRLAGFLPRGPLSLPPGGAHWYVVERVGFPDPATFGPTFAALSAWADAVVEEAGIPPERVVLGGFSQGGAVALHAALGHPERLAGLFALSTYLPGGKSIERARSPVNHGLPVFQAHGSLDPLVPVELGRAACAALRSLGHPVEWHEYPMQHQVSLEEIQELARWLGENLGK